MSDDFPNEGELDVRPQLEMVANPPGLLPTGLWGRSQRARVYELAIMMKAGVEGMQRPLELSEVNAAAEYLARRSTLDSYMLWTGGGIGAFLSTRKALRGGWTSQNFRPWGPPPPVYNGWNVAGFPQRFFPGRGGFFIRLFFNVYFMGNTFNVLAGPAFASSIPSKLSDPQAFDRLRGAAKEAVENSLYRRQAAAKQLLEEHRQGNRNGPPQSLTEKKEEPSSYEPKSESSYEPPRYEAPASQDEGDLLDWKEPTPAYGIYEQADEGNRQRAGTKGV